MRHKKTKNQIIAINKRRNKSLEIAANNDPGFSCQGKIGEFIGLYIRCEIFATSLQNYYQTDNNHKKSNLRTDELSKAIDHFGLVMNRESMHFLFKGGRGSTGNKSARQLRNGYLHQLSDSDKKEIEKKHSRLVREMKKFLNQRIQINI